MIKMHHLVKKAKKYAEEIDQLSYSLGDAPPGGDIRLRAGWIKKLMEELEKEEDVLQAEIKRDEASMERLNYILG